MLRHSFQHNVHVIQSFKLLLLLQHIQFGFLLLNADNRSLSNVMVLMYVSSSVPFRRQDFLHYFRGKRDARVIGESGELHATTARLERLLF